MFTLSTHSLHGGLHLLPAGMGTMGTLVPAFRRGDSNFHA